MKIETLIKQYWCHKKLSSLGLVLLLKLLARPASVFLTAKDSSGNNIGVGGETIFVMVSNQCTRSTNMSCTPVSGATTVVANTIVGQMTDNGDGTYSYSFTVSAPGKITVSVIVAVRMGVAGEYFNNPSLTPPSVQNLTTE